MIKKYFTHAVFIPALIYSLYFPSFESALLTLIALGYHCLESFLFLKSSSFKDAEKNSADKYELILAELKDDMTKIKMAHSYKR